MNYKKPQIVARSTANKAFVACCPLNKYSTNCRENVLCNLMPLK